LIIGEVTLEYLDSVYRRMGLPELFVYCHREDGAPAGFITGYIHQDQGICHVEHMIVLPGAPRKFHVMMQMSKDATRLLHDQGIAIVLKILDNDPRTGLRAWAKRMAYEPYAHDHEAQWYINRPKEPVNG